MFGSKRLLLAAVVAALSLPASALAELVVSVPFSQKNPSLPHPAYEGAHITLKAYVRDAGCGNGYFFTWDVNRGNPNNANDPYGDDWRGSASREGNSNTVRFISRTFLVPNVDRDTPYNINVRVTNRCNNQQFFATFRLFIYNWRPSNDPRNWTRDQLEIIAAVAGQESMWYLHRKLQEIREANTNRM